MTSVPPPYCVNANDPFTLIVTPAPAVIVQVPAPLLAIKMVSPTPNTELFTVIVVEPALFIMTRLPTSPTTNVYDAVWSLIGNVVMLLSCDAVKTVDATNGNGLAMTSTLAQHVAAISDTVHRVIKYQLVHNGGFCGVERQRVAAA